MKRIFISFVLACASALTAHAQEAKAPDGFLGIKWGTPMTDVNKVMSEREGLKAAPDPARERGGNRLFYVGGTFSERPALQWGLDFVGNKLYRAAVVLKPSTNRDKDFETLEKLLSAKYGPPTEVKKVKEDSKVVWQFPVSPFHAQAETLTCWSYKSGAGVKIVYQNESLKNAVGATAKDL